MRVRFPILALGLVLLSGTIPAHKFYVSLTEIRFNSQSERFEISMRIFPDDLDRALELRSGIPTHLATRLEPPQADSLLELYLFEHFNLKVNGEVLSLTYLGKEPEADVFWCYFESEQVGRPVEIFVHNDILTGIFEDQVNIVQVYAGDWNRSILLGLEKKSDHLTIKNLSPKVKLKD